MKTGTPVSYAIVVLYILVASALTLPILRFVETYALATGYVKSIEQACLLCRGQPGQSNHAALKLASFNSSQTTTADTGSRDRNYRQQETYYRLIPAAASSAIIGNRLMAGDTANYPEQFLPTSQIFMAKVLIAHEKSMRCRKMKAIISEYSFSNIQTRRCMGKIYQFVALRKGQKFQIQIDAFTRKLVEISIVLPRPPI